jgi:single-strand DNA-binding protein
MSRQTEPATQPVTGHNAVSLVGRLTAAPVQRELPSGDLICTFRISVPRSGKTTMTARSKQSSDWVDCVAASGRARRVTAAWQVGDVVSVEGVLRRRVYRAGEGTASRVEVEVTGARRVARA